MSDKNCSRCGRATQSKHDFCPYCGNPLDEKNDWGMLGKNDHEVASNPMADPLSGGFGPFNSGMINKMFGSAMKMLEKELQKDLKDMEVQPKTNIQLFINGKKVNIQARPKAKPQNIQKARPVKEMPSTQFSKEKAKKFSSLKKTEPITNVRRLSDRIIYEIEMPEVKSLKDISIAKFENSIEIKAIGKKTSYYKIIQIQLPIVDYYLEKGTLIIELSEK